MQRLMIVIAISAEYTMNMSSSKDVKFYLKEMKTGKIIAPVYRDNTNNNLYFNVPTGLYKVLLITIKETTISKSIIFDDSIKMVSKTMGLIDFNQISTKPGFSLSGVILTGDKKLDYQDKYSNIIKIEPNLGYYLGCYKLEGYIEGIFNDMPNIRIRQINPVPQDKLESFKKVYMESFPNSSKMIITNVSLFNTDCIDLAKANAHKWS